MTGSATTAAVLSLSSFGPGLHIVERTDGPVVLD